MTYTLLTQTQPQPRTKSDSPKPRVSRRPLKLVLFEQMHSEVVASAETLVANVALVARSAVPLWTDNAGDEQERL